MVSKCLIVAEIVLQKDAFCQMIERSMVCQVVTQLIVELHRKYGVYIYRVH